MNEPSAIFEIIHSLVNHPEGRLSVSGMCRIAGVSRSGCYAWVKAAPIREAQEEQDRKDFDISLPAAWVFQGCTGDLHEAPAHGTAGCDEYQENPPPYG